MRILILDDNEIIFREPANWLIDAHDYRNDTIVQVAHPDTFWTEFEKDIWDEIWLDHDLGSVEYSGKTVSKRFAEMGFNGRRINSKFVVITMNPSVADNMASDLDACQGASVVKCPISFLGDGGVSRGNLIQERKSVLRRN